MVYVNSSTRYHLLITLLDASTHADDYRNNANDSEIAPFIDPSNPGELPITQELKTAFLSSLQELNVTIRFYSGSWNTFNPLETIGRNGYDVLLTSETIYRSDSLRPLITLMQKACTRNFEPSVEDLAAAQLKINEESEAKTVESGDPGYLCLVAAKILYFGVGGGISDFLHGVEASNARVETVLERKIGVGRKVIRVWWA
jgi:protein-histidine N-methyltransferase